MLCYDRVNICEGIGPTKSNKSREYMIYQYFFKNMDSNFKIKYAMVTMIYAKC